MRNRTAISAAAICVLGLAYGGCVRQSAVPARAPAEAKSSMPSPSVSDYTRTVLKISSENTAANAAALEQLHKEDAEIAGLARRVEADPGDVASVRLLADAYFEHGLYINAFELFQSLRLKAPEDPAGDLGLARIWDRWGDFSMALDHANRALALNPGSPPALEVRGSVYLHRNETDAALASFLAAAELDPNNAGILANAGYVCLLQDKWEDARRMLERAVSIDGSLAEAHNHLGIVLSHAGDREGALDHFMAANRPAAAHNNLGATLLAAGRYEDARQEFRKALEIDPAYLLAAQNLKEVESHLRPAATGGQQEEARADSGLSATPDDAYQPSAPLTLSAYMRRVFALQEEAARPGRWSQKWLEPVQAEFLHALDIPSYRGQDGIQLAEAGRPHPTVYTIQLFSLQNERAAQAGAEELARNSGLIPAVERAELEGRGIWYRARLHGYETFRAALNAARKLILAGMIKEYWIAPAN